MATEDLTTYTEVDTGGYLAETAARVTATALPGRNVNAYLYKDFTADYFNALDVLFDFRQSASSENYEYGGGPGFSNTVATAFGFASTDLSVICRPAWPPYHVLLMRGAMVAVDYFAGAKDTDYWGRLERAAGSDTATTKIYSDSARTNLLATLSVAGFGTATKWRYHFAYNDYNDGGNTATINNYFQNFDLQEGGGWANISKVKGVASANIAKINSVAVASIGKIKGVAV